MTVTTTKQRYAVVCQQAWCNANGYGIDFNWDGEEFADRAAAIAHGFKVRGSDDFNIAVLSGKRLVSLDWMQRPVGEDDAGMTRIAAALGLRYRALSTGDQ